MRPDLDHCLYVGLVLGHDQIHGQFRGFEAVLIVCYPPAAVGGGCNATRSMFIWIKIWS